MLLLQAQHGGPDELLLVSLALPEHGRQFAGELCRDSNLPKELPELPNQLLLTDVGVAARTTMAGAVVVDVLALLRLSRKRASASPTGHESGKRVPSLRVAGMIGRCRSLLGEDLQRSPEAYLSNSLMIIGARSGSGSIRCVAALLT